MPTVRPFELTSKLFGCWPDTSRDATAVRLWRRDGSNEPLVLRHGIVPGLPWEQRRRCWVTDQLYRSRADRGDGRGGYWFSVNGVTVTCDQKRRFFSVWRVVPVIIFGIWNSGRQDDTSNESWSELGINGSGGTREASAGRGRWAARSRLRTSGRGGQLGPIPAAATSGARVVVAAGPPFAFDVAIRPGIAQPGQGTGAVAAVDVLD